MSDFWCRRLRYPYDSVQRAFHKRNLVLHNKSLTLQVARWIGPSQARDLCYHVACGIGERGRNRTYNLLIKSQLLCQLSYAPFADGKRKMLPEEDIIKSNTPISRAARPGCRDELRDEAA